MRRIIPVLLLAGVGIGGYVAFRQSPPESPQTDAAMKAITPLVDSVRAASFPQLKDAEISLHPMRSDYIYLEGRFTFSSFVLGGRLRYMILFNPEAMARQVPPDGLRAIVAHELAHIEYFNRQSRMSLVSLIRLLGALLRRGFLAPTIA